MKNAQSWSVDIVIAVTLFIAAGVTFVALLGVTEDQGEKFDNARADSEYLLELANSQNSPISFIDKGKVNETRVLALSNTTFQELQRLTNIEHEFCIYFEDEDGNLVTINNSVRGIGSSNIMVGGSPCS